MPGFWSGSFFFTEQLRPTAVDVCDRDGGTAMEPLSGEMVLLAVIDGQTVRAPRLNREVLQPNHVGSDSAI